MNLRLQTIRTNHWSADNLKKTRHLNNLYNVQLSPGDTGQRIHFLTAVNNIDHNMDVHKDVHHQVKHRLYMPWTSS